MKRELKDCDYNTGTGISNSYRSNPYEEGTESDLRAYDVAYHVMLQKQSL